MTLQETIAVRRVRRGHRVSNHVKRQSTRPRLCVFRSHKNLTAQIVDDALGKTLASASSQEKSLRGECPYGGNVKAAQVIGRVLAERAVAAGLKQVAFDRRHYRYHGRVKALAEAARAAGLEF